MTDSIKAKDFISALGIIQGELKCKLVNLPPELMAQTAEIRLRNGRAVTLFGTYGSVFLSSNGGTSHNLQGSFICTRNILNDSFNRLCRYSVHSHLQSIVEGFVTVQGGHRVGICGTAVTDNKGQVVSLRDISSLNIRIAREKIGSADEIYEKLFKNGIESLIIAGAPMSGKTTVLRDLIRKISDEKGNVKISLIDERQEIAAMNAGVPQKDVGINTDVFDCFPKEKAIVNALKTMSPHIIAMDELCKDSEIDCIAAGANSGTKFIVTVHASSYTEILKRPQIERLISLYSFDKLVLLKDGNTPGKIEGIYDTKELKDEIYSRRITLAEPFSFGGSYELTA